MAVRDEEREHQGAADLQWLTLPWRDALGHLPAVLIASGLLLYGYLSICYYRFYGSLGVDPNDVGLSYTGTLARSSGFVAAYLLIVFFMIPLIGVQGRPGASRNARTTRMVARVLRVIPVVILGLALGHTSGKAEDAARHVKAGEPAREVQIRLPWPASIEFILLAVHADPVFVEPAGKPGDFPAVERLREDELLYLGQSSGTVVLYRPVSGEAVYVPASSIVLHVSDCSDELAGPPC
jgi:hypothetical protein